MSSMHPLLKEKTRQLWPKARNALIAGSILFMLGFAGWLQHLYTCFTDDRWGFLIAGAIFFPVAIVHGWGVWLGIW